jgi:hypothetical protein
MTVKPFLAGLGTMAQVNAVRRAVPKHAVPTRKQEKGRAERKERAVKQDVRAECVVRDGHCRYAKDDPRHTCKGPSEWAHLGDSRRARTRGQAPEVRHTTAGSLMLCRQAHNRYDGRERPPLGIRARTKQGADGALAYKGEP